VDVIARHMSSKPTLFDVQEVTGFLAHITRFSDYGGSLAARQIRGKRWSAEVYPQPAAKTQCPEHVNAYEFGVSDRGMYHAVATGTSLTNIMIPAMEWRRALWGHRGHRCRQGLLCRW
jgi:hypothetical protein